MKKTFLFSKIKKFRYTDLLMGTQLAATLLTSKLQSTDIMKSHTAINKRPVCKYEKYLYKTAVTEKSRS